MVQTADAKRQRSRDVSREASAESRDIGEIPAVADPERRERGRIDTPFFLRTYFPGTFELDFSPDQLTVIQKVDLATWEGGLFAMVMPRGSGKTSICEAAAIKAILYGRHRFVLLIGATAAAATEMLDSIKMELETNDLLADDFPEVCFPIGCLDGEPRRCKGQTYQGERTRSVWSSNVVVMPTIPGSVASGAIVKVAGITGRVRGQKFKRSDGKNVRPSLVIVDDPMTDSAAGSQAQCNKIERTLAGAILGLAGPGKKISAILPGTIIRNGDAMHRILDHKLHPEWGGSHFKMVYAFPENKELWEKYREIMNSFDPSIPGSKETAAAAATEFYRANRDEMDRGARVAWPERYNSDELSAIQQAMNLLFRNEDAFWAECQGEPRAEVAVDAEILTADQIKAKVNQLPRRIVPPDCTKLTAFIDVQGSLLYYAVCAFAEDFTGAVVDYGTWPDQKRPYFALREAQYTMAEATKVAGLEAQIYAGLNALTTQLLGAPWRGAGTEQRIERCVIDAGYNADVVKQFCRQSSFAALLTPSHGKAIGAGSQPMTPRKPTIGERQGLHWYMPAHTKHAVKYLIFDPNFWKSFLHARLAVPPGARGCLMLFGDSPALHRMLADHLTSETRDKRTSEKTGRTVDEWTLTPNAENHWLDCLVGCHVAASVQGVSLDNVHRSTAKPKREYISFAEMKQRAREAKARA